MHGRIGPTSVFLDIFDGQRGQLFLWLPVVFACGIGLYFSQPLEPSSAVYLFVFAGLTAALIVLLRLPERAKPPLIALMMVLAGFLVAGARAHLVSEPVLTFRYYGPVEGRLIKIDRSASDALRLTFDQVVLTNMRPERTPARVRISLHGDAVAQSDGSGGVTALSPGDRLMMTAHLSPPPGPTEPGGFDFQRMAWFDRLGAVGYTRVPVLSAAPRDGSPRLLLHRVRQHLSAALQTRMPDQAGAFAAAILTGDRAGISQETAENLRASNLSHLLAISGLHMGLMTGVVFYALRLILAMISRASLTLPIKKMAALGAIGFGLFYLALSGWNVATERAFIMVSVMFVAVLLDRQAISLRAVALAALLILTLRPEVLTEPGFQMSFAATTALVAVFSLVKRLQLMWHWPKPLRFIVTIILSSAVAGIATAPVAAAHFNRIADYGLIANVVAVPMMGAIVMPAAVMAAVLSLIGLQALPLWAMEKGISWILFVAEHVSGWEGAVTRIIAPSPATLPLIGIGGLFMILWRGKAQLLGVIPLCAGFVFWAMAERPAILVSADGGLIGVMGPEGRALSKPKGAGFAARSWLEDDGDIPDQARAAARDFPDLTLSGVKIAHVTGRGWEARARAACERLDVVIVNKKLENGDGLPCLMFDLDKFESTGALAIAPSQDGLRVETAHGNSGLRLWNTPELWQGRVRSAGALRAEVLPLVFGFDVAAKPGFGVFTDIEKPAGG